MAKILTDIEIGQIIQQAIHGDLIDDRGAYARFLNDLADVVGNHFGAQPGRVEGVDMESVDDRLSVGFEPNECTPSDGGVFAQFDQDVSVQEWFAEQDQQDLLFSANEPDGP